MLPHFVQDLMLQGNWRKCILVLLGPLVGQDIMIQCWVVIMNRILKRAVCCASRCEQIYMDSSELAPIRLYHLWVDTPYRKLRLSPRQKAELLEKNQNVMPLYPGGKM